MNCKAKHGYALQCGHRFYMQSMGMLCRTIIALTDKVRVYFVKGAEFRRQSTDNALLLQYNKFVLVQGKLCPVRI